MINMSIKSSGHTNRELGHSVQVDYLIFSSNKLLFAIPYYHLLQIIDSPEHTQIPNSKEYIRGFLNFMGEAIPLYDMRKKIGHISLPDEINQLIKFIQQQKQEHQSWVKKIKHAVYNNEELNIEIEDTLGSFDQWSYDLNIDNNAVSNYLSHFEKPQKSVHTIAATIDELIKKNNQKEAISLFKEADEKEFRELLELFDGFEDFVRGSIFEYAIVIENAQHKAAITADELKYFEKFDEVVLELPFTMEADELSIVDAIGRKKVGEHIHEVLILNIDEFMKDNHHLDILVNHATEITKS